MKKVTVKTEIPTNLFGQNIPESAKQKALNDPSVKKAQALAEKNIEKKYLQNSNAQVEVKPKINSQGKMSVEVKSADKAKEKEIQNDMNKDAN